MGQYPSAMQSQEPIRFSPYLYRARNLVERFFNKTGHELALAFGQFAPNYALPVHWLTS